MPAFMKLGDIKGEATDTASYRKLTQDGSILPYPGAAAMASTVRRTHPAGVNVILIGLLPVPGYKLTTTSTGVNAILIGLLLPAVQKLSAPNSSDLQLLKAALHPGGGIAFAMADGSVRVAAGSLAALAPPQQEILSLNFEEVKVTY